MTTLERKATRPKIFTESDKILSDLREELSTLSQRVLQLEHEQENNREIFDQFLIQKEVFSESLNQQKEERLVNQENYEILAGVMNKLKIPVSSVVNNLSDIVEEIQDEETQESLKECMEAAGSVLESFNEVEDFCDEASKKGSDYKVELVNTRDFFQQVFDKSQFKVGNGFKHKNELSIEDELPEKMLIKSTVLENAVKALSFEIQGHTDPGKIHFEFGLRTGKEIYGCQFKELFVKIEGESPTKLNWGASIKEALDANQDNFEGLGLIWLQIREKLWKSGGDLELHEKQDKLSGFTISFPLVDE